jgi:hypothetical protein
MTLFCGQQITSGNVGKKAIFFPKGGLIARSVGQKKIVLVLILKRNRRMNVSVFPN